MELLTDGVGPGDAFFRQPKKDDTLRKPTHQSRPISNETVRCQPCE